MQTMPIIDRRASPTASTTPNDWFFPPKNPGVYVAYRSIVLQARSAAEQAVASLTRTRRMDPANPIWANRAMQFMGITTGLLQASDALKAAGEFPYATSGLLDLLASASNLVALDQLAISRGQAPDQTAYTRAHDQVAEVASGITAWAAQLPEYVPPAR